MKKILYLSLSFPYPADSGGKIKTLNSIKTLAKKYELLSVFISAQPESELGKQEFKKQGITYRHFIYPDSSVTVKENPKRMISNFLRLKSYHQYQYWNQNIDDSIQQLIAQFQPDVIHIDHLAMAQYLPKRKKQIWIYESHNIEHEIVWSRFLHTKPIKTKLFLLAEAALIFLHEKKCLPRFDAIFTISVPDALKTAQLAPYSKITEQRVVYPVSRNKKPPAGNLSPTILFIGGLTWPPNHEAVTWFCNQILPIIHQKVPHVKCHIVGTWEPRLKKKITYTRNVTFWGFQPSVESHLNSATLFVLPFLTGGGVRLKALTALSYGLPLVSTNLGVQGLHGQNGKTYLIANDALSFARQCVEIIKNPNRAAHLSTQAILYMKQYHDLHWNRIFLMDYQKLLDNFGDNT